MVPTSINDRIVIALEDALGESAIVVEPHRIPGGEVTDAAETTAPPILGPKLRQVLHSKNALDTAPELEALARGPLFPALFAILHRWAITYPTAIWRISVDVRQQSDARLAS